MCSAANDLIRAVLHHTNRTEPNRTGHYCLSHTLECIEVCPFAGVCTEPSTLNYKESKIDLCEVQGDTDGTMHRTSPVIKFDRWQSVLADLCVRTAWAAQGSIS